MQLSDHSHVGQVGPPAVQLLYHGHAGHPCPVIVEKVGEYSGQHVEKVDVHIGYPLHHWLGSLLHQAALNYIVFPHFDQ